MQKNRMKNKQKMMRIIKTKIKIYLYSKIESTNKDKKEISFIRNNI